MSNLILSLRANNFVNRTIFPHRIFIYNDVLIYRKRQLLRIKEITIAYSHISQIKLIKGIFFASIEIINTGGDSIFVKGLKRGPASEAKKIIDQKIFSEHAKHRPDPGVTGEEFTIVQGMEKSLNRLKELFDRNRISLREYNKRRADLLI